jgi:hypothetical protein
MAVWPLVFEGLGRDREPRLVGEQGDTPVYVAALHGVGEASDQLALARGGRQPRTLTVTRGKSSLERRPGALEGTLHGGLAGLEHLRDLRRPETEHVAQYQYRPLSRWQVLETGHERQADRLLELVARLRLGRGIGDRVEECVGVWLQPNRLAAARGLGRLGDRLDLARAALVSQRVQAAIRRDAVKPGAQRGSPVESLEPAPGGQQRLL